MAQGLVMFGGFLLLALVRVPIAFALLLSGMVLFTTDFRLQPWVAAQRMFSGLDSFVLLAVPFFVLAGAIMNASQVTQRLVRLAHAIVGSVRGGLGMVNVGTSMLFAGVSGSSTADTAGVGSVLIPAMRQRGYSDDFSVAVTASSSVIGTIIPPSIQMIVWGALTGTSIAALFLGGVLPGLLIGVGMMLVVYVAARRRGFPAEDRLAFREVGAALRDSLLALGIPIVVIGGIVAGLVTATEASVLAVLYALVLGVGVYRTIGVRDLPAIFVESARLASLPLFALGAAGLFGGPAGLPPGPLRAGRRDRRRPGRAGRHDLHPRARPVPGRHGGRVAGAVRPPLVARCVMGMAGCGRADVAGSRAHDRRALRHRPPGARHGAGR